MNKIETFSPTQITGYSPALMAAWALRLTMMSLSFQYCRRSEWPMMAYLTPSSLSMAAETSPV